MSFECTCLEVLGEDPNCVAHGLGTDFWAEAIVNSPIEREETVRKIREHAALEAHVERRREAEARLTWRDRSDALRRSPMKNSPYLDKPLRPLAEVEALRSSTAEEGTRVATVEAFARYVEAIAAASTKAARPTELERELTAALRLCADAISHRHENHESRDDERAGLEAADAVLTKARERGL